MRLAIDIDSTLHPYWDQLAEIAKRRYGVDLPYDHAVHVGDRPPRARAAARRSSTRPTAPSTCSPPSPTPARSRRSRAGTSEGHYIHITSHRATDAHPHTAEWLEQIGLPHDDLYCSYDKITRCVELQIDVLIDDSPENLRAGRRKWVSPPRRSSIPGTGTCPDVIRAPDWPTLAQRLEPHLR